MRQRLDTLVDSCKRSQAQFETETYSNIFKQSSSKRPSEYPRIIPQSASWSSVVCRPHVAKQSSEAQMANKYSVSHKRWVPCRHSFSWALTRHKSSTFWPFWHKKWLHLLDLLLIYWCFDVKPGLIPIRQDAAMTWLGADCAWAHIQKTSENCKPGSIPELDTISARKMHPHGAKLRWGPQVEGSIVCNQCCLLITHKTHKSANSIWLRRRCLQVATPKLTRKGRAMCKNV